MPSVCTLCNSCPYLPHSINTSLENNDSYWNINSHWIANANRNALRAAYYYSFRLNSANWARDRGPIYATKPNMTVELAPFILNNSDSFQPACHVFVCATDDDYLCVCVCIIGRRHIGRQPDGTKAASTRFVAQSTLRDHFQSFCFCRCSLRGSNRRTWELE